MARILQINVDRIAEAHSLVEATATNLKADVLLISEPNQKLLERNPDDWYVDLSKKAAIKVLNRRMAVKPHAKGDGFVAVTVRGIGTVYSCYKSPATERDEYNEFLQGIDASLRRTPGEKLVAGDFNGKSILWNSCTEDWRGRQVAEWIEARDLVVLNTGDTPTFVRGASQSILDITLATSELSKRVETWQVLDEEVLSLHRQILFDIVPTDDNKRRTTTDTTNIKGWNVKKADPELFLEEWRRLTAGRELRTSLELTTTITLCCDASMPRRGARGKRKPVYWWNADISRQRETCQRVRRAVMRARKQRRSDLVEDLSRSYRAEKRKLKRLIRKAKEDCWQRVCEEVEHDTWGLGYKIVMKKLKKSVCVLDIEEKRAAYHKLFPSDPKIQWTRPEVRECPPFTRKELENAVKRIKTGKAPGRDQIPPEVVKLVATSDPEQVLRVMNGVVQSGVFPAEWKRSRLVLIPKGKPKEGQPQAYRPLSMLDVLGKLAERLIANRLITEIEEKGGLSPYQFGFVAGKTTTDAMKEVLEIALGEKAKKPWKRELVALVTLDVKNAFNTVPWQLIVEELIQRGVSGYLVRIIQSYLEDRYTELEPGVEEATSRGVPQGSVLGPLLWNIFYDELLRISRPHGATLVAFADDVAAVVTARTEEQLMDKTNDVLGTIKDCLDGRRIQLCPEKTEACLLIGQKQCGPVFFELGGHRIDPAPKLKYLGVIFDQKLIFAEHVKYVAEKASKTTMSICRLMPRLGGASEAKRRILAAVADSIILYAPAIWKEALKVKRHRANIERIERRIALRICGAFRTTSTEALRVICRRIPLELLAEERTMPKDNEIDRRTVTLHEWQQIWDAARVGRWTYRLIGQVEPWFRREHGLTNYYLMQFLTGHGCFREYLVRFKLANSETCPYCDDVDTAEHVVFNCPYFAEERRLITEVVGQGDCRPETIIGHMLRSRENWECIAGAITTMIRRKENENRQGRGLRVRDG